MNTMNQQWDPTTTRYVSLEQGAAYLSVSVPTLRRAIRRGDLKAKRIGRQLIHVNIDDLEGLGAIATEISKGQHHARDESPLVRTCGVEDPCAQSGAHVGRRD
jgi:excisionase family DNA binding protein